MGANITRIWYFLQAEPLIGEAFHGPGHAEHAAPLQVASSDLLLPKHIVRLAPVWLGGNSKRTCSLWGLRTVSSTLKIRQAASAALAIALSFTKLGSQTNAAMLSRTPDAPSTSTPYHMSPL